MAQVLTTHFGNDGYRALDTYVELGGYAALRKAIAMPKEETTPPGPSCDGAGGVCPCFSANPWPSCKAGGSILLGGPPFSAT